MKTPLMTAVPPIAPMAPDASAEEVRHLEGMTRRRALVALSVTPLLLAASRAFPAVPSVSVHKLVECGCCDLWAEHLRKNGFAVSMREVPDLSPVRKKYGVPRDFGTCHTAMVEGYVVEGHVPAADIRRMLREKPKVAGLAVPGMPAGSPGMEGPRREPYEVLAFERSGAVRVYARYR